jgi:hypothetical protein
LAHLIKAFVLFVTGFVILANLGDALDKKGPSAATSVVDTPYEAGASVSDPEQVDEATEADLPEKPIPLTTPVVREGSHAQVCASFDPVERPEQVLDILEYASQTTGTPVDVLYAIWRNETGHVDGAGKASGGCDFMEQVKIRCALGRGKPDLEKCSLYTATRDLAKRFQWAEKGMTCSCGTATWDNNTHYFGGCCGPFQFSSDEIFKNASEHGLDPMTFCGGAILAGWELKDHHDRYVREGSDDIHAWRQAISRYFGSDTGSRYWRKAKAQWIQFHSWYEQGTDVLRKKVTEKSVYSAAYHRKLRAARASYTSNP